MKSLNGPIQIDFQVAFNQSDRSPVGKGRWGLS